MIRPVAFTDHATRRPVNLQAECDARGADYPERETEPGRPPAARPARTVSRWRPTRYASADGLTWYVAAAPRRWIDRAPRVAGPPARVAAHARAARVAQYSRELTVGVWCAAGIAALLLIVVTSAL